MKYQNSSLGYFLIGFLIAIATMAFVTSSYADSTAVSGSGSNAESGSTAISGSSVSDSLSYSGSQSGATSNIGGNAQSIQFVNKAPNTQTVRSVPGVSTGNVFPTSPCMGGTQVGGSGVGFGFSVGTSWKDDECGLRETARSFQGIGLPGDAIAILCSSIYAKAAPTCQKTGQALAQPPAPVEVRPVPRADPALTSGPTDPEKAWVK
jgi:hypothetical protein